jgi:hypothetical protein
VCRHQGRTCRRPTIVGACAQAAGFARGDVRRSVQHLPRVSKARSHSKIASLHRAAGAGAHAGDAKRLTDAFTKKLTPD